MNLCSSVMSKTIILLCFAYNSVNTWPFWMNKDSFWSSQVGEFLPIPAPVSTHTPWPVWVMKTCAIPYMRVQTKAEWREWKQDGTNEGGMAQTRSEMEHEWAHGENGGANNDVGGWLGFSTGTGIPVVFGPQVWWVRVRSGKFPTCGLYRTHNCGITVSHGYHIWLLSRATISNMLPPPSMLIPYPHTCHSDPTPIPHPFPSCTT